MLAAYPNFCVFVFGAYSSFGWGDDAIVFYACLLMVFIILVLEKIELGMMFVGAFADILLYCCVGGRYEQQKEGI